MALQINVDGLIHQRKAERIRIEYKSDWNPEPVIHTITAFANSRCSRTLLEQGVLGGVSSDSACSAGLWISILSERS